MGLGWKTKETTKREKRNLCYGQNFNSLAPDVSAVILSFCHASDESGLDPPTKTDGSSSLINHPWKSLKMRKTSSPVWRVCLSKTKIPPMRPLFVIHSCRCTREKNTEFC
jgi:hypothetical protein